MTSCSNTTEKKLDNPQVDTIPEVALWADEYIIKYLERNKDRLTEVDGHPVTYIKETTLHCWFQRQCFGVHFRLEVHGIPPVEQKLPSIPLP